MIPQKVGHAQPNSSVTHKVQTDYSLYTKKELLATPKAALVS